MIGADVADALFPAGDPLGQTIRIAGRRFTVIGVQARLGSSGGGSLDKYVWMPLRAYERAFGAPRTPADLRQGAPGPAIGRRRGPRAHLAAGPRGAAARRAPTPSTC